MRSSFRLMSVRTLFVIVLFYRNFEMACEAYGLCSHSCDEFNDTFNCSLDPYSCTQACNNYKCNLDCHGGLCSQNCNSARTCGLACNRDKCSQICNSGECSLKCISGERCEQTCNSGCKESNMTCDGERCSQTCNGDKCSLECRGKHCQQTCNSGKCNLECHGETCEQKCHRDCNLECYGGSCEQDCRSINDQGSCRFQCPVLSDAGECQQNCQGKDPKCTINFITTTEAPTTISEHYHTYTGKPQTTLLASSTTASNDASDKSQNISRTKEMVKKFISALNRTDPQQDTSLQDAVSVLQNATEQLTNISHVITEQEREGFIFKVIAAFEDFSLNYGHYHLNESMPQLTIAHSKLILHIQRFFRRNARDFILKGPEKHNFINIPSRNFLNNDSVLLGIVYKDLHEVLKSNPSNSDATKNSRSLDTMIMAATMDPKPEKLRQNITLKFRNLKVADGKRYCMFWSGYSEKNPEGWSGEGCHVVRSKSSSAQTECSCNHMTHFAVFYDYGPGNNLEEITKKDEKIRKLTCIGLAFSVIGIIVTIISYAYFTDVHQPLSQIRMSLHGSLGAGQVIFLAGIYATGKTGACVVVAFLMQYFLMAAFCWMLVEGIYLYLFVAKDYNINNKMTIYHVMSWCLPAVMLAIALSIAAGKDGIKSFVSDEYCWLASENNLIWIFVAFVVIIEVVNMSILMRVIKKMTTMQSTGENHILQIRLDIKACAVLTPFLGATWLLAILSPLHKAFVYTFTILNSSLGFLIFFFHCVSNIQLFHLQIIERFRGRINAIRIGPSANDGNTAHKTSTV